MSAGASMAWGSLRRAYDKTLIVLDMIKFEHTVFALPFALIGAWLGAEAQGRPWPAAWEAVWIVTAMTGARSFAMSANRFVDREIDSRNPRTADRALPARLLSERDVIIFAAASMAIFLLAVWQLAPITRWLWPPVMAIFVFYPYTKRFTWTCHLWLGVALGLAPMSAYVAITGRIISPIWLLGLAVMCWSAGFDIIYACQDIEVDRREGLHSLPAHFGIRPALALTRALHTAAVLLLAATGLAFGLGPVYLIGVVIGAALLAYENWLVRGNDLSRIGMAFFTMNGVISVVLLVFTAGDAALRRTP